MNKIHLHYTHFPNRQYMSVSAIGLTPERLEYFAQRAGFFVINTPNNSQKFISKKTNVKAKIKLYVALESAGYDVVSVSADRIEILPPIPSTLPADSPARKWLGDEAWYCGVGGAA